jgi:hypothetical protein
VLLPWLRLAVRILALRVLVCSIRALLWELRRWCLARVLALWGVLLLLLTIAGIVLV